MRLAQIQKFTGFTAKLATLIGRVPILQAMALNPTAFVGTIPDLHPSSAIHQPADPVSGLNRNQELAVQHETGPMLVLAGAGTGKTRVITFRIARLIRSGTDPARILAVTFTNKAANEMQERLRAMLRLDSKKNPLVATFHSLCVRILRRHIQELGYPKRFAIYSGGEQEGLARSVLRDVKAGNEVLSPSQMIFQVSNWKSSLVSPSEALRLADTDKTTLAAIAFRRYQQELKRLGAVDFDDLLLLVDELFRKKSDILEQEASRFDQILVDEYQDTNESQYRIVKALAGPHRNLCVVGDDDQSIYGWRGAEVKHILGFARDWPDTLTVRLEENYRSNQAIIAFANELIRFNKVRHEKQLNASRPGGEAPAIKQFADETQEARETVEAIKKRLESGQVEPRHFAILFRTNEQPRLFEQWLRKYQLPYVLVGTSSFFDQKEVQDLVAYLRVIEGTDDDATALRILNRPARGVGKKATESLVQASIDARKPVWEIIEHHDLRPNVPPAAAKGLDRLLNCVRETRERIQTDGLAEAIRWMIHDCDYRQEVNRCHTEPEDREQRWNAVQQVVNSLAEFQRENPNGTLGGFLDEIVLGDRQVEDEKEKQLRRNAIALMTLHSAKGLEFSEVYMVGLEEGILPHFRSLADDQAGVDEERRLCYVGVTRAEDSLTLSMALTRMKWGKPRDSIPSRFLYEMSGRAEHPNYDRICSGRNAESTAS